MLWGKMGGWITNNKCWFERLSVGCVEQRWRRLLPFCWSSLIEAGEPPGRDGFVNDEEEEEECTTENSSDEESEVSEGFSSATSSSEDEINSDEEGINQSDNDWITRLMFNLYAVTFICLYDLY